MININDKIAPGDVIAVGDIHATWEPFRQFLNWVEGTQATVVLLGDMIDRGGDDLNVLNQVYDRFQDPETFGLQGFHVLMGNHERLFLEAAQDDFGPYRTGTLEWLNNGGNFQDCWEMRDTHAHWIEQLPLYMVIGENLFVHAGTFPGHNPAKTIRERKANELLWMRDPFLRIGPQLEKWNPLLKKVVHGHTPTPFEHEDHDCYLPVVKRDRVNIDTGACFKNGCLTAYNVTQNTFQQFLK